MRQGEGGSFVLGDMISFRSFLFFASKVPAKERHLSSGITRRGGKIGWIRREGYTGQVMEAWIRVRWVWMGWKECSAIRGRSCMASKHVREQA
jgi:hypothetical protein